MKFKGLIIFLLGSCTLFSQDVYHANLLQNLATQYQLQNGQWVFADSEAENQNLHSFYGNASMNTNTVANQNFNRAARLENFSAGDFFYDAGYSIPNQQAIQQGDNCLMVINLRRISNRSKVSVFINATDNTVFEENIILPLHSEWTQYLIPFQASRNYAADELVAGVLFAWEAQEFEVAGMNILNFGNRYSLDQLPRVIHNDRYEGYEANAPWRAEAAQRIEQNRKANLSIEVVDANGAPVENATVSVNMLDHAFQWGVEIALDRIAGNIRQNNQYEARLLDMDGNGNRLNWVVPGNSFKWLGWENNWMTNPTEKVNAIRWLQDNDFKIRQHTMVWPGWTPSPVDLEANANPNYIRDRTWQWIEDLTSYPGLEGVFEEYDILNEFTAERDYERTFAGTDGYTTGREIYTEIMEKFAQEVPNVPQVINDYVTISQQQTQGEQYDFLKNALQEIVDDGAPLSAIGFQAHIGTFPTSIYEVEAILNDFGETFNLPLKITEYDTDPDMNDAVAGQYLEDFLTMVFSLEQVEMFMFWGFWDGYHWFDNGNFYDLNWNLKPAGRVAFDKIFNEWWTEETNRTANNGLTTFRPFKGQYEVVINYQGETITDTIFLDNNQVLTYNLRAITTCPPQGTACNDNNPATENDIADGNCGCVGTVINMADCNLITNSEFETGIDDWNSYGCTPVFNAGTIEIGTIVVGVNPWDAAVGQFDLTLTEGQSYTITFNASANAARTIAVKAGLSIAPFTGYLYEEISLTPQMESYSFSFVMNEPSTTIASLDFFVGTSAITVFLDNVSLQLTNCEDGLPTNDNNPVHPVTGAILTNSNCVSMILQNATICQNEWGMECQYLYDDCIGESVISPFIHVDQFGYRPADTKVAILSDPIVGYNDFLSYTPSTTIEVRNAESDRVVFTGTLDVWNNGATQEQSGDRGWWFDFSTVTIEGTYYIFDAANNQRSATFDINENVYQEVLKHAGRMFYYNRSGIAKEAPFAEAPWIDGIDLNNEGQYPSTRSFFDQDNPATARDLSGGWWDAGDMNKYVTFTNRTLHNLMWAFLENPNAFTDDWNLPESGNGIPDILDEVKWELDWLLKMNNPDGSTILKVGSLTFDVNESTPPSSNTTAPLFYISTCSSASIAVASTFAQAATIFRNYPAMTDYADLLEQRAITTWNYVLPLLNNNQLADDCDNGEVVAGDADWSTSLQRAVAVTGAIHLYDLTGDQRYHNYIINNIADTEDVENNGSWSPYHPQIAEARLLYVTLNNTDATTRNYILNSFRQEVEQDFGSVYGFETIDLYRADMPDWAYHSGSNLPKAGFGILNLLAAKSNISPNGNAGFRLTALEKLHYFHGVNPQGITYLSNMYDYGGDQCADEIYHVWFQDDTEWDNLFTDQFGPPPGYLVGGANQTYEDYQGGQTPNPPGNQPIQKSYWSFNDFEFPSWSITEPGIYYQAAYIRLLADFTNVDNPCPLLGTTCDDNNSNTTNDVVGENCNCSGRVIATNCNQIVNGDFEMDIANWNGYGCTPMFNSSAMEINGIMAGTNPWDAGAFQSNQALIEGQTYTISFDASAAANRMIAIKSGLGMEPFTEYFYEEINLTTQTQSFSFPFTMNSPTTNLGTLEFFVGTSSAIVTVDNISLQTTNCSDNVTSIYEANRPLSLNIYPNPTSGSLTIASAQGITLSQPRPIEIIDIWGRVVLTKQISLINTTVLDIAPLSDGIYFLKIGAEVHRFVLNKD